MVGSFSDEDVESAKWDDGEADSIGPCRNLALIRRNKGEASIVLDASDGDCVADACKGGTRPVPASRRRWPHGGRQLSLHRRQFPGGGYLTEGRRRWGSHRSEETGTVTREFNQPRNTLHDGRAYCCLFGIIWVS